MSNHLGNVLVTVSDKKIAVDSDNDGVVNYYNADVITANDFYPFGMTMTGRKFSSASGYRYGFNGQENSDEIGAGLTTAMYWEYDSRIGRRWNVDPVINPSVSPYACFDGNPILMSDPNGDQPGGPGDEVDPNNKSLKLPARAVVISRLNGATESWPEGGDGKTLTGAAGGVNSFSIDGKVFNAMYDKESGNFTRYAEANDTKKNYEVSDYFEIQQADIGVWGRGLGLVQGIGGVLEMAGGATIGAGTAWTGFGAIAGGAIMFHGADNAAAGFLTAFTGCPTLTFTEKAVMLTGASESTASLVNAGLSVASGVGTARFSTGLWNPTTIMLEKSAEVAANTVLKVGIGGEKVWQPIFQWGNNAEKAANATKLLTKVDINRIKSFGVTIDHIQDWKTFYLNTVDKGGKINHTAVQRVALMYKIMELW